MKSFLLGSILTFTFLFLLTDSKGVKPSISKFINSSKENIRNSIKNEIKNYKKSQENAPLIIMGAAGRPIFIPKNVITNQTKESNFKTQKQIVKIEPVKNNKKENYKTVVKEKNNYKTKITIISE